MEVDKKKVIALAAVALGVVSVIIGFVRMGKTDAPELPSTVEERIALAAKQDSEELAAMTPEQLASEHFTRKSGLEGARELKEDTAPWETRLKRVEDEYTRRGLKMPK